jgi:hypothetical protein
MSALQIFSVALIAVGCKIISLEPEKYDGLTFTGVGVNIIPLVSGTSWFPLEVSHTSKVR